MEDKRAIIIVGNTGGGKSSLASTLVNPDDDEKVAETSGLAGSCTDECEGYVFTNERIEYKVIDTIGGNDTSLSPKEVLIKLVRAIELLEDQPVNQVVWVIGSTRLSQSEVDNFNIFNNTFFDNGITPANLTVVRSSFGAHDDEDACKADFVALKGLGHAPLALQGLPDGKIIHIDNDWTKHTREAKAEIAKEDRKSARAKVLEVLALQIDTLTPVSVSTARTRAESYKTPEEIEQERQAKLKAEAAAAVAAQQAELAKQAKKQKELEEKQKRLEDERKIAEAQLAAAEARRAEAARNQPVPVPKKVEREVKRIGKQVEKVFKKWF